MFVFVLFKDRKKALIMTIVMGLLLAVIAATLLPLAAKGLFRGDGGPRYKKVEAVITDFYADTEAVLESDEDSAYYGGESWIECGYTYKGRQYTLRIQQNVSIYEYKDEYTQQTITPTGQTKRLYVNTDNPNDALEYPPEKKSSTAMLPWLVISLPAFLFVITLVNYLSVLKKERKNANP